jgi:hypothetical protein
LTRNVAPIRSGATSRTLRLKKALVNRLGILNVADAQLSVNDYLTDGCSTLKNLWPLRHSGRTFDC